MNLSRDEHCHQSPDTGVAPHQTIIQECLLSTMLPFPQHKWGLSPCMAVEGVCLISPYEGKMSFGPWNWPDIRRCRVLVRLVQAHQRVFCISCDADEVLWRDTAQQWCWHWKNGLTLFFQWTVIRLFLFTHCSDVVFHEGSVVFES